MKSVSLMPLCAAILLAGCAGSSAPSADSASWYNPLSWHWSALNPLGWFASTPRVTEQGVGTITAATPMTETAISDALGGNYHLRKGMRGEGGKIITFWQALRDDKLKMVINGQHSVSQVVVMDEKVSGPDNITLGTPFSQLYREAFGACKLAGAGEGSDIRCQAPASQHIWYQFSGEWHGPLGLMPDNATLQKWRIDKIIWQQ
ncbi:RpoE-regulated lipoprotein [Erwinia sp. OLTSP20]|uniref:RpoE-regulated lipoprotein n=1 Tax=unclassified Erwinia TaxID=2622719 RepID=UPI000C1A022D|nr:MULTISPECIES: RpoE-regulated lipoprotein [unclassified Erwinia]PIJ51564.1 RpoE-regulated lipoprotein [Erwinia sp. OAMSP11]PIJ75850.1 RpoE-regulated lipoprotein [Erwinia sp. OLSSP12]PIJ83474.1 RpoE-regulated lipoprotein [Erwinia sp. OLCASP19]PIJ86307.1 RpoE-regulated lipoprotein [Erwinia sp. OLMTSP26]PIJ88450.1 RpoE-regulated lipoprotein [Erwinia sp. OLMDSP33]